MSAAPGPSARQVLEPCPFCGSGIVPSPGLAGTYQHTDHVRECIIGDAGILDTTAWNRRATDPAVAELVEALRRALPSVQSDAEMMDAIDRHNPLPAADMPAVTKAANELDVLVDDIRALLAKHAAKP